MGFTDLSNQAMTVISGIWLDPTKVRPILVRLSRVAPLIADLEDAHTNLLTHQQPAPRVSPEMAVLNEKVAALDARHDRLARGLYDLLSGIAALTDDADEADAWRDVQRELFPEGKSITLRSYIDQAGEAARVEQRLSERTRRMLETFPPGDHALIHHVRRWLAAGKELGEVETERRVLAKESPGTPTLREVRNGWINTVKTIVGLLDRETSLSESERRRVLEPLESELAKAEAKKRSSTVVEAKAEAGEAEKAG